MGSALIELVLVAEEEKDFLRGLERQLKVNEVVQELREAVENYVLSERLLDLQC